MGYFQYPTLYSVNYVAGDNKAAALIPGAAPDRRAATERCPESNDEIGSAARRGGHSGWRPFMMSEAGSVHHRCRCFVWRIALYLSGKGKNYRPRNFVGRPPLHYPSVPAYG